MLLLGALKRTCKTSVAKMESLSTATVPPPEKRLMTWMPDSTALSMCMSSCGFLQE